MKTLFEENFEPNLDGKWTWVHEETDAWKVVDGVLHLRTLPGTLWGDPNNAHNFLLRSVEYWEDGIATRVTVSNAPEIMGEQAGLIWYQDDDNYIKFVKESLEGVEWIVLAREEDGQPALINKIRISGESAELQLVHSGSKVRGEFRISQADDWQVVGECPLVGEIAPLVGLFTHGGPEEIERWVQLSQFQIGSLDG